MSLHESHFTVDCLALSYDLLLSHYQELPSLLRDSISLSLLLFVSSRLTLRYKKHDLKKVLKTIWKQYSKK